MIGKPTGNDIKEKKMTLPLIYVLNKTSGKERKRIIRLVKTNNNETAKVNEVINFVIKNGGIEYATIKMKEYRDKAISLLNDFPDSEAKNSLIEMVRYTTSRNK